MSNETKTQYTATFKLVQDGLDGEVTPALEFNPLVDPMEEEAPAIYEYMSNIALNFLHLANVIDDEGKLLDPDKLDTVELNLSTEPEGTLH